jgi:hypothetical protein
LSGRPIVIGLFLAASLPTPVSAQLSEVRIGAIGSYVGEDPYKAGAGVTLGYSPGRLAYVGVRWIYHFGSTSQLADDTGIYDVTDQAQLFGVDLGAEFPLGAMELVVASASGAERASAVEFVVAPMAMLHVRVGPVMLVPQATYYFAGRPDLRWFVHASGPALSLSVIVPFETDRIRY